MEWDGRQLKSANKNGTSLSFVYNSDGIRLSKTMGSTTTKYLLNGTQILAQKTGSTTLCFFYDQQGNRVGMADSSNHFYYYLYNLQGDVIALADASTGKLAATYTYDAWGKIVKINGIDPEEVAESSIAKINPFRYRGYYYDQETGFYYLNSRYYDADTGRFINADSFVSTGQGVLGNNMFAYCGNNPIVGVDPTGEFIDTIFDVISLGMSIAEVVARPADPWAWAGLAGDLIDLIPGVTGVGETVHAAKASKKLVKAGSKIINKKYAGKVYKLGGELAEKYGDGVKFSKYGFPDFSPFAKETVTVKGLTGRYAKDAKLANKSAGLQSTPAGFTWHHVEDGRTMQLIPKDLHKAVRHTGGCAVIKYL